MVVSSFLVKNHKDLVIPPTQLGEIIEFGKCGKGSEGIGAP